MRSKEKKEFCFVGSIKNRETFKARKLDLPAGLLVSTWCINTVIASVQLCVSYPTPQDPCSEF